MRQKLIAYECVSPDHKPSVLHPDKLTIHDGEWAFCAFDARADGHHWRATGGAPLEALTVRAGLMSLPTVADSEEKARTGQ